MNRRISLKGWPYILLSFIFLFLSSAYQNDSDAIYYLYCIQKGVLGGATGHPVFFYIHSILFKGFSLFGVESGTYARLSAFLTGVIFIYVFEKVLSVLSKKTISKPVHCPETLKFLLLFSAPVVIYQVVIFQVYILAALFVLLAHLSALRSREEPKEFYLFSLWSVLSLGTHLNSVFFIFPLAVWFFIQNQKSLDRVALSLLTAVFLTASLITPLWLIHPNLKILRETLIPAGQIYFFNFNPLLFLKMLLFIFLAAGLNLTLGGLILIKGQRLQKIKKEYRLYYLLLFLALGGQILLYATSAKVDFIRHAFILSVFATILNILLLPKSFQKLILWISVGLTLCSVISLKVFLSVKNDVLKQTFALVQNHIPAHSALIIDTPEISYYPFYTYLSASYDLYIKRPGISEGSYLQLVKKGYLLNEVAANLPVHKKIFILTNSLEPVQTAGQNIYSQKMVSDSFFVKMISLYHRPHSWYKELYLYPFKG